MSEHSTTVETIRTKLGRLAEITPALRRDFDLEVPPTAALGRDWEAGRWLEEPIHPNQLSAIENALASALPEDYRAVIAELANGMVGPGAGVKPLVMRSVLSSTQRLRRRWSIEGPLFPDYSRAYDRMIKRCGDGALVLAELRSATVYALILTGEERGSVWYDDSANSGVVAPLLMDETGHLIEVAHMDLSRGDSVLRKFEIMATEMRHASFGEWYLAWLDKMLAAARSRFPSAASDEP